MNGCGMYLFDVIKNNCSTHGVETLSETDKTTWAHYHFCFNLSISIIESYMEYQYIPVKSLFSAQSIYTATNSSRTKENITTKRK